MNLSDLISPPRHCALATPNGKRGARPNHVASACAWRRSAGRRQVPTGKRLGTSTVIKRTNHAVFAKCCACFLELARHLAYVSKPFLATSAAWTSPTEVTRSYSAVARKRLQCSGLSVPFSSRVNTWEACVSHISGLSFFQLLLASRSTDDKCRHK